MGSFISWVPTPWDDISTFFELAPVTASDVVYDLGCGDGRLLLAAIEKGAGRAVGVELDPAHAKEARDAAQSKGLSDRVQIVEIGRDGRRPVRGHRHRLLPVHDGLESAQAEVRGGAEAGHARRHGVLSGARLEAGHQPRCTATRRSTCTACRPRRRPKTSHPAPATTSTPYLDYPDYTWGAS